MTDQPTPVRMALVERETAANAKAIGELTATVGELVKAEHERQGAYATLRIASLLLAILTGLLAIGQILDLVGHPG
jgi:hypothetical protein